MRLVSVHLTVTMQNDGGAKCFIFTDPKVFLNLQYTPLLVRQLDGSTVSAKGYYMVVIRTPGSEHMLVLWPSYYYPEAPHNTFSPNSIKHYLLLPSVITEHTQHLTITLQSSISLQFPSLTSIVESSGLDLFNFEITPPHNLPSHQHSFSPLCTRRIVHHYPAH
jgi:hypothetical protein